jgi:hypothetical protein
MTTAFSFTDIKGAAYFNPDEAAELIRVANPGITLEEAQSVAWDAVGHSQYHLR